MGFIKVKEFKDFVNSIPSELDDVELLRVDFVYVCDIKHLEYTHITNSGPLIRPHVQIDSKKRPFAAPDKKVEDDRENLLTIFISKQRGEK